MDAAQIAQQADDIELYKKLLDLSSQALDLQAEIAQLKEENVELKKKKDMEGKIIRHELPFITLEGDSKDLYYCSHCWDSEQMVLVYKCGQEKLNNLYYQVKEQRRCSTWQKTKNLTLWNLNSRLWICTMPEEPRIHNWSVNMA